jgi:hypothetical protein
VPVEKVKAGISKGSDGKWKLYVGRVDLFGPGLLVDGHTIYYNSVMGLGRHHKDTWRLDLVGNELNGTHEYQDTNFTKFKWYQLSAIRLSRKIGN